MNRITNYGIGILCTTLFSTLSCDKTNPEKPGLGKELVFTAVEKEKAGKDNLFAFELFRKATTDLKPTGNALLSPLSVGMALAMTNNGAAGETRVAIEKTLRFDGFSTADINAYYRKLMADLPALDPKTTLNIANSIWYRHNFNVLPSFLDINRTYYQADVSALDFADPKAPNAINDWVNKKTNRKIPTIIDGGIPADMVMYLINAVYFKGDWEQRFNKSATSKRTFTRPGNNPLQTDFMHVKHTFNIAATDEVEAIELPYGNRKYSMVILMPRNDGSLAQLVEKLPDTDTWATLTSRFQPREVQLSLPKFKFSYENRLNDELTNLGMGIAFGNGGAADFSEINGQGGLQISEVKHKSFIEVNEEGTEAAAVTSVGIELTSAPPREYVFNVDRPFVFAIREMNTGLILFVGQVNDPSVSETKVP